MQRRTKVGAQVHRIMAAGELVTDDLVESVLRERLTMHDWNHGFLVDGFPPNERQAEFFLEKPRHRRGDPARAGRRRNVAARARRLCSRCGVDYTLLGQRPSRPDRCDVCGGKLVQREDDNRRALTARLRVYHDKTKPIIDLFERKEFVARVDANRPIEAVQVDIREQPGLPAEA